MWLTSLIPSKPRLFDCRPRFSCPPTTERPRLPPCLLLHCLELSMRKWCTELNSRIKNKEWAAAAAGFGVTGEVGRSSCELEFQRPTPAEVVGSAHTFHISQSSLGWDSQKEGELGCFFYSKPSLKGLKHRLCWYIKELWCFRSIAVTSTKHVWIGLRRQKRDGKQKKWKHWLRLKVLVHSGRGWELEA